MTLQASGQISLDDIHVEAGGTTGTEVKLNDPDVKFIIKARDKNTGFDDYYEGDANRPSATHLTHSSGSGFFDEFINVNVTLGSGTKLVVVCYAHNGFKKVNNQKVAASANSFCNLGNNAMTLACRARGANTSGTAGQGTYADEILDVGIYYLETTLTGNITVSGDGGGRPCMTSVYVINNYTSATPYTTDTETNTNPNTLENIVVASQKTGVTIGVAMLPDPDVSHGNVGQEGNYILRVPYSLGYPVDEIKSKSGQTNITGTRSMATWKDEYTPLADQTYQAKGTDISASAIPISIATASFK